jgi:hypothetical protein
MRHLRDTNICNAHFRRPGGLARLGKPFRRSVDELNGTGVIFVSLRTTPRLHPVKILVCEPISKSLNSDVPPSNAKQ